MRSEVRDRRSEVSRRRAEVRPATLAPSHPNTRGFTLIEMIVVIAIIILLVSLTIGLITTLHRGAETRSTENELKLLDLAYEGWKRDSEREISYGIDNSPQIGVVYEIQQTIPVVEPPGPSNGFAEFIPMRRTLSILNRTEGGKSTLRNMHSNLLVNFTPALPPPNADLKNRLVDAWETEIIVVFPGRTRVAGDIATGDEDGTIRTQFEDVFGVCENRRARFVSAGPDGRLGDLSAPATSPAHHAADDNIYSYPLEEP